MNLLVKIYETLCRSYNIRVYGIFFTEKPTVFFFWHSKFFVLPYVFRDKPVRVLISPSRDGEIIDRFIRYFGLKSIRSSYRKEKFAGLRKMIEVLNEGGNVAITPDGPIGPPRRFKKGTISTINKLGVRCVFVGISYSNFWRLDTWDNFEIPMPYSSVSIYALEGNPRDEREAEELMEISIRNAARLL